MYTHSVYLLLQEYVQFFYRQSQSEFFLCHHVNKLLYAFGEQLHSVHVHTLSSHVHHTHNNHLQKCKCTFTYKQARQGKSERKRLYSVGISEEADGDKLLLKHVCGSPWPRAHSVKPYKRSRELSPSSHLKPRNSQAHCKHIKDRAYL